MIRLLFLFLKKHNKKSNNYGANNIFVSPIGLKMRKKKCPDRHVSTYLNAPTFLLYGTRLHNIDDFLGDIRHFLGIKQFIFSNLLLISMLDGQNIFSSYLLLSMLHDTIVYIYKSLSYILYRKWQQIRQLRILALIANIYFFNIQSKIETHMARTMP